MKLLSTKEVAAKLGVTPIRVRQLIQQGRLAAQRIGRDYAIEEKALDKIAPRPLGRPKAKTAPKASRK